MHEIVEIVHVLCFVAQAQKNMAPSTHYDSPTTYVLVVLEYNTGIIKEGEGGGKNIVFRREGRAGGWGIILQVVFNSHPC